MTRIRWGTDVDGWLVEDTGGRVLVAVREVSDDRGRRLAVAVSDEVVIAFRAIGRPYEWAMLDDFLDAMHHEKYWSAPSVQEVLARVRHGSEWEVTRIGAELFGDHRKVLQIVKDGLGAIQKVLSNKLG